MKYCREKNFPHMRSLKGTSLPVFWQGKNIISKLKNKIRVEIRKNKSNTRWKRIAKYPESTKQLRATQPEKWPPVCRFSAQKRGGYHGPWSHCSGIFQQEERTADKLNGRLGALTKFKAAGSMPTSNFSFGLSECHLLRSQFPAVLCSTHTILAQL